MSLSQFTPLLNGNSATSESWWNLYLSFSDGKPLFQSNVSLLVGGGCVWQQGHHVKVLYILPVRTEVQTWGWPMDSLCAKPHGVSGHSPVQGTDCMSMCCPSSVHAETYAWLYITYYICQAHCMICCALVYLEAGGVLCHWFKEIPLSVAGSLKQLIINGWHVQLLLMYGNRREIRFNWFNIMKKMAFILL